MKFIEFKIPFEEDNLSVYATSSIMGLVHWYNAVCSKNRPAIPELRPFEIHTRQSILDTKNPEKVIVACIGECERNWGKSVNLKGSTFEEKGINLLKLMHINGDIVDFNE